MSYCWFINYLAILLLKEPGNSNDEMVLHEFMLNIIYVYLKNYNFTIITFISRPFVSIGNAIAAIAATIQTLPYMDTTRLTDSRNITYKKTI